MKFENTKQVAQFGRELAIANNQAYECSEDTLLNVLASARSSLVEISKRPILGSIIGTAIWLSFLKNDKFMIMADVGKLNNLTEEQRLAKIKEGYLCRLWRFDIWTDGYFYSIHRFMENNEFILFAGTPDLITHAAQLKITY